MYDKVAVNIAQSSEKHEKHYYFAGLFNILNAFLSGSFRITALRKIRFLDAYLGYFEEGR